MATVKEIHDNFYDEARVINIQARKFRYAIEEVTPSLELPESIQKLVKSGFSNSKPVKEAQAIVDKAKASIKAMDEENPNAKFLAKYAVSYPYMKIITKHQLVTICAKYGLIFGHTQFYIDEIPEKNMNDIINFSIKEEDKGIHKVFDYNRYQEDKYELELRVMRYAAFGSGRSSAFDMPRRGLDMDDIKYWNYKSYDHLFIAAMPHMFNAGGRELRGREIITESKINKAMIAKIDAEASAKANYMVNDPIVLAPLNYNVNAGEGNELFAIITAWGEEASDPMVLPSNIN